MPHSTDTEREEEHGEPPSTAAGTQPGTVLSGPPGLVMAPVSLLGVGQGRRHSDAEDERDGGSGGQDGTSGAALEGLLGSAPTITKTKSRIPGLRRG